MTDKHDLFSVRIGAAKFQQPTPNLLNGVGVKHSSSPRTDKTKANFVLVIQATFELDHFGCKCIKGILLC